MPEINHISWEPKFSVNIDEIDIQHRKLFDVTNQMIDIYKSNSKGRLKIIEELVEYANVHFRTEKTIMINSQYPDFEEHLRDHDRFIDKVGIFLQGLKKQEESLSQDIVTFLIDWIYNHTTTSDLKIGEHVLKSGSLK